MAAYELLAVSFFLGFAAAVLVTPPPWRRRLLVGAASLSAAALVMAIARWGSDVLRAWAPHLYIVWSYYLPAMAAPAVHQATAFERWLLASDTWWRQRLPHVPAALVAGTELAYLICYPLVPASFVVVWTSGTTADITRFWTAVLLAAWSCYVSLPWLLSRPPRLLTGTAAAGMRSVNVSVLGRVSHQLNTFPSGHVAVSAASAVAVGTVSPVAGAVVGAIAVAIAVGAASGRYHYIVDVLIGLGVGLAAAGAALTL